jgi:hypothetical protein
MVCWKTSQLGFPPMGALPCLLLALTTQIVTAYVGANVVGRRNGTRIVPRHSPLINLKLFSIADTMPARFFYLTRPE